MGRNEDPLPDLLVDAAHLAAHFSTLKGDSDVEVIYTRRRYVQKPRGAAHGSVRLLREKTINLRVEPSRLEKILRGQASAETDKT
jgi:predicted ribosome quality control (RQC) complex YloA/Tae2 family protein